MTTQIKHRLGILLSGRGSNFLAIADSIAKGRLPNCEIAVVISNLADAGGLEAARERGLNAIAIEPRETPSAPSTISKSSKP